MIRHVSRRAMMGLAAGICAVALAPAASHAGRNDGPAEVAVDELMKKGDLPDMVIGSADAKITIVEYASMTCGHCKHFHDEVLPELKKKYIDTGKAKLIFREFPLDARAMAASMLARCTGDTGKALSLIDVLFTQQADWAFVKSNPQPKMFEIAKQAGFTQESFEKCLTDQKLLDQLTAVHTRASEIFGVSATPTFFINGKRLQTAPTMEEFDKVLGPLVQG